MKKNFFFPLQSKGIEIIANWTKNCIFEKECMTAFVVLTCIHFALGIGMDIFLRNESVKTAIFSNIPIAIGISFPFIVLYVLFGISVGIKKSL